MTGMNMEPMKSHALSDRFRCAKCGIQPQIMKANYRNEVLAVTLCCHGKTKEWTGSKGELFNTKEVFEEDATPEVEES